MAYESQQPRNYDPALSNIPVTTQTWGTTGNTETITDASIHPTSAILVTPTSIPAGFWKVVVAQGSAVITSSDSESAGLGYNYRIL